MLELDVYEHTKRFINSEAMDTIIAHRIKQSIHWIYYDYVKLQDRVDLEDHEKKDMEDMYQDIIHLENVYLYFSGDYEYRSILTGDKVFGR